ncbi:MAG: trypsin-like peptidase domain-containing protein [Acidobacteria bacterium]|nr:trypsin-like peptidase domain-containing protein [Acidobacteriota bacterium]
MAEATADGPESSAPPLEDVIEQAMPGVVMIRTQTGRGSGFYVRPDLIMTNAHVVQGSTAVSVTTRNSDKLDGRVTFVSDDMDVALVQVGRLGLTEPQLKLGESGSLRLGEDIIALGWAESEEQHTVARGIVTGLRRVQGRPFLQTDAAPHHGDSGGPVMNRHGEVVGITTARAGDGTAGFAVPIDDAKGLIDRINQMATDPAPTTAAAPPPIGPSAVESRRAIGTDQFTATLAALARRADALDAEWNRYTSACGITATSGADSREWFQLFDPRSAIHQTAARCQGVLNSIQQKAHAINTAMLDADETARRADVFPGTRRDLRRRFRLEYSGWDR